MPHRSSVVFGSLFAVGLCLITWSEYYPVSPMFAVLGMTGPRANSGRPCRQSRAIGSFNRLATHFTHPTGPSYRPADLVSIPTRYAWCGALSFDYGRSFYGERVTVDGVTKQIASADVAWSEAHLDRWRTERDSVIIAMQRRGGREFVCPRLPDEDTVNFTRKYWRFKTFFVRLTAGQNPYTDTHEGTIAIAGFSEMPAECTTAWLNRQEREHVCDDAPVKIPLPGNRILCFRGWLLD
jgi:hypothetical protein